MGLNIKWLNCAFCCPYTEKPDKNIRQDMLLMSKLFFIEYYYKILLGILAQLRLNYNSI
jgi:hypothetical protein